jgi:hypothetical protein
MSARDRRFSQTTRNNPIRRIVSHAGRARTRQRNSRMEKLWEALETRVFLAGDHPSFEDVFNTNSPATMVQVPTNGDGVAGTLATVNETDALFFVAPANDFVRVWIDTVNVPGSTLDSRVEIYTRSGPNNEPLLVSSGSNNGPITAGPFRDGWTGFIAQAGQEYVIIVRGEMFGPTGDYLVRVHGTTTAGPNLNATTGEGNTSGNLSRRGDDIVYRVTPGSSLNFLDIATITVTANPAVFDPRVDLYDEHGVHIRGDSDAGHLTDAFTALSTNPDTTFYVRVRSDKLGASEPSTGNFELRIDAIADVITMNPVTRLGQTVAALPDTVSSHFYKFQAQGTGTSIISLLPVGLPPLQDSAIRLYDQTGVLIGFNELPGAASRLFTTRLEGGKDYFVVVENFNGQAGGTYFLHIEAHHTFTPSQGIDDHQSTPTTADPPPAFGTPEWLDLYREFSRATPIIWGDPQEVPLYDAFAPFPFPNNPTVPWTSDPTVDHPWVRIGKGMGRIHGVEDTDLFQFVPPIDMMGTYTGFENPRIEREPPPGDPPQWAENWRPSTRVQAFVNLGIENGGIDGWVDTRIRILDSNFAVVYDFNNNVLTGPFGEEPSGILSPAYWPPALPAPLYGYSFAQGQPTAAVELWGGEVYYLEVSSQSGIGRYDIEIMVDAENDPSGNMQALIDVPTEGQWNAAYELQVLPGTGAAVNRWFSAPSLNVLDPVTFAVGGGPHFTVRGRAMDYTIQNLPTSETGPLGMGAAVGPGTVATPGTRGRAIIETHDLAQLTSVTDKDLYMFRAIHSGYAEIVINTSQLDDRWFEAQGETEDGDPMTPMNVSSTLKSKTYNSPLDSALRVFNNDFVEIGYNDDNGITAGEARSFIVGAHGEKTLFRRDARVVIPVVAGNNYFVQVESGQLDAFNQDPALVDWRHATGSYELLVNSMVDLGFLDDHWDWTGLNANTEQFATPMLTHNPAIPDPLDPDIKIVASADGFIDNGPNPFDSDTFIYYALNRGVATFTVAPRDPTGSGQPPLGFARTMEIYNSNGSLVGQTTASGTDPATVDILVSQGDRFFVVISGDDGAYTVDVRNVEFTDDHGELRKFHLAHVIDKDLYDYDGTETILGAIENPGDTDVFAFDAIAFDVVNVTVEATEPGLSPVVDIYEVSEDPEGNAIFLRIAHGAAGSVNFSVTGPPRTSPISGLNRTTYYAVVSGADPASHFGTYAFTLTVNVTTDDHPDAGQWELASEIFIDGTGNGGISGNIEVPGDTDLFQFMSPAQGPVTITVAGVTTMRPRIQVFDENQNNITDELSGNTIITGPNTTQSTASFQFTGQRNRTYFILVEGVGGASELGEYGVTVVTPIPDDHANVGEFEFATPIQISIFDGTGVETGMLEVPTDSDLFTFTTVADGNVVVNVNAPGGIFNNFRPFVRFFDAAGTEIGVAVRDGDVGDEDGIRNGQVRRTLSGTTTGQVYYILVSSDQTEPIKTGPYSVFLSGNVPPMGDDDHPNAGQWNIASVIPLNDLNGDGQRSGRINSAIDTDLFVFVPQAGSPQNPRTAFVQVVTPAGQELDVKVEIFTGNPQFLVASDSIGGPAANAQVTFDITSTNKYWVLVTGLNGVEGDYIVKVDTSPAVYTLIYPEGFRSPNINEYVSIGNPSETQGVSYTVRLRFEDNSLGEMIIASNVLLPANSRGGVTISNGLNDPDPGAAGVPFNKPYAIIIESDGFLAANISHYDFNSTLGEAFTDRPSSTWSFARGSKFPGQVNDFLVYYNPNPNSVRVTLTAYQPDGTPVAMSQVIEGNRRGGWSFNDTAQLPTGDFAFTVTSESVNPSLPHMGIVAALSHYDLANNTGYGTLGDPGLGATTGILPLLLSRTNPVATSEVTFFNSSDTPATIGITGRYIGTALPNLTQTIDLGPWQSITLDAAGLGMTNNQIMGLRYDANTSVTALGGTRQFGATDVSMANTQAADSWFWGDAFINRNHAGTLYFENMYFYNPTSDILPITLNFQFNTGETRTHSFEVGPKDFATVALHQLQAILGHRVFNWFSIEATADAPFVAKLTHYDLVLNGGWGSRGAPLGITTPVGSIV